MNHNVAEMQLQAEPFTADDDGMVLCQFDNLYVQPTATLNITKSANRDGTFGFVLTDTETNVLTTHSITTTDGSASELVDILAGHSYIIEETTMPDHFTLDESQCSGDATASGTTFTADDDGMVLCQFDNLYVQPTATLNITKSANRDGTFGFVLTDTETNVLTTHSITTTDGSASELVDILAGHSYIIEETTMPDHFTLDESQCSGDATASGTTFTADDDGMVLCQFDNLYVQPTATLNITKSANRDGTFGFVLTDTETNVLTTHSITTTDGSASELVDILAGHSYIIEETTMPDHFTLDESQCSGDATASGTTFTADDDGMVLCQFDNLYVQPTATLNITKSANRDGTFGFVLTDTETSVQSKYNLTTVDGNVSRLVDILAGHSYTIEEADIPDNFNLTGSECSGDGTVSGTTFTADVDSTVFYELALNHDLDRVVYTVNLTSTTDTIDLQWRTPNEEPTKYRVSWAPSDGNYASYSNLDQNAFPTDSEYIITGLEENTEYKVRIKPVYDNGSAPWTEDILITTGQLPALELVPAVSGITFTADDDGMVLCQFDNLYVQPTATLNITKSANRDGTFGFVLTDTETNVLTTHSITTTDGSASELVDILAGHSYTIEETTMPDHFTLLQTMTAWRCWMNHNVAEMQLQAEPPLLQTMTAWSCASLITCTSNLRPHSTSQSLQTVTVRLGLS